MTATTHRSVPGSASTARRPAPDTLAGTGTMVRLVLRRNRVRLAVWWVVLVGLFAYVTAYYKDIFATQAALDDFAAVSNVPSIKALTGLAAAPNTLGGAVWTKIWMTCALSLAFGVVFLVTRNGRADEEVGRTELLRSRMLGLHAYSTASWLVIAALCVAVGVGVALASAAGRARPGRHRDHRFAHRRRVDDRRRAVRRSASAPSRVRWRPPRAGANALGSIVLGACYVLRMVGDLGDGAPHLGLPDRVGPADAAVGGEPLVAVRAAGRCSRRHCSRSQRGWRLAATSAPGCSPSAAGGPAPAWYATPLGLGLRLQRGPIIGWTAHHRRSAPCCSAPSSRR